MGNIKFLQVVNNKYLTKKELIELVKNQKKYLQIQSEQLCHKDRIINELQQIIITKDQRIAELESDLENLTAYDLKKSHEYSIKGLIQANEILSKQCKNSRISYKEFLSLQKENEQLKQQLAEKDKLLENAIVPKFKIGDEVYYLGFNCIYKGIITKTKITNSKKIQYSIKGTDKQLHTKNENDIFATKQEAEEALKKLNKE